MGTWEPVSVANGRFYCYHRCSYCEQKIGGSANCVSHFHFCPNCGEPMNEKALEMIRKREGIEKE